MCRSARLQSAVLPEYVYETDAPRWSDQFLWSRVLRILKSQAPPPSDVFELGCGNGSTARLLAAEGYRVVAVDPSPSGIEQARQHQRDGLRFEVGSTAEDLGAKYGRFPVVLSLEVIEHLPSPSEYMKAIDALLAPDGVAILSTPYHGYLKNLALVAAGRFDRHFDPLWESGHLKFYSRATLRELVARHGFTRCEIHRVGRIPPFAKSMIAVIRR